MGGIEDQITESTAESLIKNPITKFAKFNLPFKHLCRCHFKIHSNVLYIVASPFLYKVSHLFT